MAICREPDCTNAARRVQGARYCGDHARSKDYRLQTFNPPTVTRTCPCGSTFNSRRKVQGSDIAVLWDEFCLDCRSATPLSYRQLVAHRVPVETARSWIIAGRGLLCQICDSPLDRKRLVIDHDHNHCPGQVSCGLCVRGVLCPACNTTVGHVDKILARGLGARVRQYIGRDGPFKAIS